MRAKLPHLGLSVVGGLIVQGLMALLYVIGSHLYLCCENWAQWWR